MCTTSTSRITGAGLKKCMPDDAVGPGGRRAIRVTGSDEVFVARTVCGGQIASSSANSAVLTSSRSGTASVTRSARARSAAVGGEAHPGEDRVALGRVEPAAVDGPSERALEPAATGGEQGVVDLDRDDVEPGAGEHLDDAGAHRAEPDHARGTNLHATKSVLRTAVGPAGTSPNRAHWRQCISRSAGPSSTRSWCSRDWRNRMSRCSPGRS